MDAEKLIATLPVIEIEEITETEYDHDRAVYCEQQYMVLMDEYQEIARALGFEGTGWWGDVGESHSEILKEAEFLRSFYLKMVAPDEPTRG